MKIILDYFLWCDKMFFFSPKFFFENFFMLVWCSLTFPLCNAMQGPPAARRDEKMRERSARVFSVLPFQQKQNGKRKWDLAIQYYVQCVLGLFTSMYLTSDTSAS